MRIPDGVIKERQRVCVGRDLLYSCSCIKEKKKEGEEGEKVWQKKRGLINTV